MRLLDAWLDGVSITEFSPNVIVTDVQQTVPQLTQIAYNFGGRDGAILDRQTVQRLDVTVKFLVREYSVLKRQTVVDQIIAWAMNGGKFTDKAHSGKIAEVVCTTPPVIQSALHWTDELSATFTAFGIPYWQDEQPEITVFDLESGGYYGYAKTETIHCGGNAARCLIGLKVVSNSAMSAVNASIDGKSVYFSGLSLASGKEFIADYDKHGLYYAKADGVSCINKMSAASSDGLSAAFNKFHEITVSSNDLASVTVYARGLYL